MRIRPSSTTLWHRAVRHRVLLVSFLCRVFLSVCGSPIGRGVFAINAVERGGGGEVGL